jgi:hypothetical protein
LKSTTAGSDNKSVSLELDVTGLTNPAMAASNLYASLKSAVKIAIDGKTYAALGANDNVAYDNETKKLTVTFENALTSTKAKIQVAASALALTPTSANNKVLSPVLTSAVIDVYPQVVSVSLSPDNKTVLVKYNETIVTATSPAPTKGTPDSTLLNKIKLATDGTSFITEPVSVRIVKDTLSVTFSSKLVGSDDEIEIGSGAVQDAKKKKSTAYESDAIATDDLGPVVDGVGYKTSDKTLTLFFNEPIFLKSGTTLTSLATQVTYNGTSPFTTPVLSISKNKLVIMHKTPAITSATSVTSVNIPTELLQDAGGIGNLVIETDKADSIAPVAESNALSNSGKDITINFDENLFSVAKSVPLGSVTITTGSGLSAVTKPISDALWKTTTTTVTIAGSTLKIANLKTALSEGNVVTIKSNAIMDLQLNKNLTGIVVTVDTTAPTLTDLERSSVTETSATLTFNVNETGTYLLVGYTEGSRPNNPPTGAEIRNSIAYGSADVLGGAKVTAAGVQTAQITDLNAGVMYFFYVVMQDSGGNYSTVATDYFETLY